MFKILRRHTKTVVWVIVAAFVLWGASSLFVSQNRETSYAGEIFHKKVSHKEYNEISKMLNLFSQPLAVSKNSGDTEIWFYLALKREAERRKIPVFDVEVRNQIMRMFGGGEKFDPETYRRWIENVLKDQPRSFEELVREYIRIQKLVRQIHTQPVPKNTGEMQAADGTERKPAFQSNKKDESSQEALEQEKIKMRFEVWAQELVRKADIKKY